MLKNYINCSYMRYLNIKILQYDEDFLNNCPWKFYLLLCIARQAKPNTLVYKTGQGKFEKETYIQIWVKTDELATLVWDFQRIETHQNTFR
jgi:hypothetical protein